VTPADTHRSPDPTDLNIEAEGAASASIMCKAVTLDHIRHMNIRSDERKTDLMLGFKHICRGRWCYAPPVVGIVSNGNDPTDIRWIVGEAAHSPEDDQYNHLTIRSVDCTKTVSEDVKVICSKCAHWKKRLMERFNSQLKIRAGEFTAMTRHNILSRLGSLQKQALEYHKRQSM